MPKKHVNSNEGNRLSYDSTEISPNVAARPTRILIGMFKYGSIRGERT